MTADTFATGTAALDVNGPEDVDLDWDAIDWRSHQEHVRRLRQRIFKATQNEDLKRVSNLQKLMLRSRSNTLVSVRQVAQRNAGHATAGIDGQVALTSRDRADLAEHLHRHAAPRQARPVKRVYIPKANDNGARSEFRRSQFRTGSSSQVSGSVLVTHPFHPLCGQALALLFVKRRGGDVVFVCTGFGAG